MNLRRRVDGLKSSVSFDQQRHKFLGIQKMKKNALAQICDLETFGLGLYQTVFDANYDERLRQIVYQAFAVGLLLFQRHRTSVWFVDLEP